MSTISLTTPGLLFSAISLLLLAYNNRFLAIASLIRSLHDQYLNEGDELVLIQIKLLRKRVYLIKTMQTAGITSLFMCVLCMFLLFGDEVFWGKAAFGVGLLFLLISLGLSVYEIIISANALNMQLKDIENDLKQKKVY